jgi:Acetyltransferase (GNAT) domain
MDKTYSATRVRPEEHREALARLWKENLAHEEVPREILERRMRWFQEQNPAGPARTWMGYHGPEREIIGSGSFYPRDIHVSGRKLKAGILGDFAVTRAHRIAGAAMSIQREIAKGFREAGVDFLFAFPNKASFPIFQRAGYKKIGEALIWVKPLAAAYKLDELSAAPPDDQRSAVSAIVQQVVERAGVALPSPRWRALWEPGGPAPFARAVSSFTEDLLLRALAAPRSAPMRAASRAVDAGMALQDTATLLARRRPVTTELVDAADERFDALWSRARRTRITGERSAEFLNWRYAQVGTVNHRFFCVLDRGDGRLLGYAVYSVRNNKVEVADFFCEDLEGTFDVLFLELFRAMRRRGHVAVGMVLVGPPSFGPRMRALGFFPRALPTGPSSRWLIAHVDGGLPEELRREMLDINSWLMTDGELDA